MKGIVNAHLMEKKTPCASQEILSLSLERLHGIINAGIGGRKSFLSLWILPVVHVQALPHYTWNTQYPA